MTILDRLQDLAAKVTAGELNEYEILVLYKVYAPTPEEALVKLAAQQTGNRVVEWNGEVVTNDVDVYRIAPDGTKIEELTD